MRTERRKEQKQKKKKGKFKRFVMGTFKLGFFLSLIVVIGICVMALKYKGEVTSLFDGADAKVSAINEGTFKSKTETIIYDSKGKVLTKLAVHDYHYTESKNLQPTIRNAFIAIEDNQFLEHNGIDLKANARVAYLLVKNKGQITQGGSTITQQLVKNIFLTHDRTYKRKFEEIIIAMKLEHMYSKEQLMEFYVNNIYYGNGAYGIETASRDYFNKPSSKLTLSEVAMLAGLPNNPSIYDPVRRMDKVLERRDRILFKMKEQHFISQTEYQEAKEQKIVLNMPKRKTKPESYEVSFVLSSATKLLMEEEGFKFKYWFDSNEERNEYWENFNQHFNEINKRIRNGGYKIYSTIDHAKQKALQETVNKKLAGFTRKNSETGLYKTQGASVTIDNQTGDVVAIIGGRTQDNVDNTFNRAFLSYRQPGSIIKPIVAYTPAFEKGMLASSTIIDKPLKNGPKNAGGGYRGRVTLREATERSINTVAFQLVMKYTPKKVIPYLTDMNFSNLVPGDNNAGIAIGGFTYGTNALEMASAYSTLSRNGEYIKPTGISKISDVTNTVVYKNKHAKKRVYDSGSAYLMTDVLKGVMTKAHGTGKSVALKNMISAGKTGTTNDSKDAWFAGYTPYYTTVVWVGNDKPESISSLYGATFPGQIWKDYMTKIHKGLKNKDFKKTDRISYMYLNPNTGEVDKKNNHGWWRKELVPEIYWEKQEEAKRLAELKRQEALKLAKEKRLAEEKARREDYKKFGLTEEEERERESVASLRLQELEFAYIMSKDDFDYVSKLIIIVKETIERVKHQDAQNLFYQKYYQEVKRLEAEKYDVEHPRPIQVPKQEESLDDVVPEGTNPTNEENPIDPVEEKDEVKTEPKKESKPVVEKPVTKPKPVEKPVAKPDTGKDSEKDTKPVTKPITKPEPKPEPKPDTTPKPKPSVPTEDNPDENDGEDEPSVPKDETEKEPSKETADNGK